MKHIQPPSKLVYVDPTTTRVLFLAGSIEMDKAVRWQDRVVLDLVSTEWTILNPRRDKWDGSMVQSIDNPAFVEQVEWEMRGMEIADTILFYFAPGTMSPISLLELGLHAQGDQRLVVVCPPGFWRKGNVDIVCRRYDIEQFTTLDAAVKDLL